LALLNRQFDNARQQCREAQRLFQGDWELQLLAAQIEFFDRRFDTAEPLYRDLIAKERSGEPGFSGAAIRFLSAVGFIRRNSGDDSGGKALLEEARHLDQQGLQVAPDNPRLLCSLAADFAALGHVESALYELNKAVAAGWIDYRSLSLDPRFDSIRETKQFKEILAYLTDVVKRMDAKATIRAMTNNS